MNFAIDEINCLTSPLFAAFHPLIELFAADSEPAVEIYNRLARQKLIVSGGGHPVQFVPPSTEVPPKYEVKIFLTGEIETRGTVRHDLFNAWVWLTFPKTKAAINAGHYLALQARGSVGRRSSIEDALTLLDENGVIVVCSDPELIELLKNAEWKTLFWRRRADVIERMRVFLFGHGLLEKAMHPYVGMCAHSVIFLVEPDFFQRGLGDQLNAIDELMAAYLIEQSNDFKAKNMAALPLLGVPGYFAANTQEAFYDNHHYFRPKIAQREQRLKSV